MNNILSIFLLTLAYGRPKLVMGIFRNLWRVYMCNLFPSRKLRIINLHIYPISIILLLSIRDASYIKNYRRKRGVFMKEKRKQLLAFALTALVLMVLLLVFIFRFSGKEPSKYTPGSYTSDINLDSGMMSLVVTVDDNRITDISLDLLDETMAAMYPLTQSVLDNISQQIYEKQSLDGITYVEGSRFTSIVLLNAIQDALSKAQKQPE